MPNQKLPPDWKQTSPEADFTMEAPAPEDIVLGRGNQHANHPGNARFYEIIDAHIPQYDAACSKFEKSRVVQSIFESISSSSRFVKRDKKTKTYSIVDDLSARQKISHAIRYRKSVTQQQQQLQQSKQGYRKGASPVGLGSMNDSASVAPIRYALEKQKKPDSSTSQDIISDQDLLRAIADAGSVPTGQSTQATLLAEAPNGSSGGVQSQERERNRVSTSSPDSLGSDVEHFLVDSFL